VHPNLGVRHRLGLQVLFDFTDIIDAIGFAVHRGFGVLELNLGNIRFQQQLAMAAERRRIRRAAELAGISLAIHAIDGPSYFIASDRVRKCGAEELKRTLDHAADIGARNVVMHLGFDMGFSLADRVRFTHEEFPDYYRAVLSETLSGLKAHACGRSRLCIENVAGFRYPLVKPIIEKLLGGNLGLCYDVGHVNVLPPVKRRVELAFLKKHLCHVYHCHIHDNSGARDEHQVPGQGNVDFLPFFRQLVRTDALLVFEVRPRQAAVESLAYFKERIEPHLTGTRPETGNQRPDARYRRAGRGRQAAAGGGKG
jgi:sugar phosphate isomerase/epimerase